MCEQHRKNPAGAPWQSEADRAAHIEASPDATGYSEDCAEEGLGANYREDRMDCEA